MDIDERKQKIIEILNKNTKVKVNELSELFNISEVTIRMDLADLEARGLLSRVHGGAVSSYRTYFNMNLQQRLTANQTEKRAIAEEVVKMIENNDTIMFNSGTTNLTIFRMLSHQLNLNIVTNSVSIAIEAGANPNFNVILIGGSINSKYQFTYGDDANAQLERYHADKLILSVDGISAEKGLTTYYDKEAELDRIMLSQANLTIVAADYTKIGRTAFAGISPVSAADFIVTNKNTPDNEIDFIKESVSSIILV